MADNGNGYMARIEELQRRADHADGDRQRVWERLSAGDRQMGVIENEVKHVRGDVAELGGQLAAHGEKLSAQTRWLVGTAISFTALAVTIVAVFG